MNEERDQYFTRLELGEVLECPCCGQTGKIYRRSVSATMARQLIVIYKASKSKWATADGWVNVKEFYLPGSSGDYAKLRFWGLLESKDKRSKEENAAGMWRITPEGREFVEGKVQVCKYVYVYNNDLYEIDGQDCEASTFLSIKDVLGKKFDYAELIQAPLQRK